MAILLSLASADAGLASKCRTLFLEASDNEASAEQLFEALDGKELEKMPLLLGYRGAARTILAKHAYNPYRKYQLFSDGSEELDEAIGLDAENVELRFLRFTVQDQAPGFLGYNSDLSGDKNIIISYLKDISASDPFHESMRNFMAKSANCTTAEREMLSAPISTAQ